MFYFLTKPVDVKLPATLIGLLLLWSFSGLVKADIFPRPASLQPNIDFWKRVYTEIDKTQGFLHDERDLSIVYGKINLPINSSRHTRKRIVKREREKLRKLLIRIAGKSASKLKGREKHIRQLLGKQSSAKQIRAAARKIRFQLGQADKFANAVNKSGIYTPYIKQQFAEAGLPVELSALPFVESSFNIAARSHVGAAGIWQFMPGTGRRFMKVNHVIDERYDPYRATKSAIRLLQYNYDILRSWPLAITAYNHGIAGMRRAIKRTGSTDIGVISAKYKSRTFGFASRNFYAEFIAALEVSTEAEKYFASVRPESPFDYTVFKLDHYVPARIVARTLGVKLSTLKAHNLALREPVWEGEKHMPAGYDIRIPAKLLSGKASFLLAGIPKSARYNEQTLDKTYRVRRGDSLSRIAATYKVRLGDLVMMNNLRSRHRIRAGQVLYLPQKGVSVTRPVSKPMVIASAVVASADVIDSEQISSSDRIAVETIGVAKEVVTGTSSHQQLEATDPADYSVSKGGSIEIQAAETLGHYADWLGIRTNKLRKLNRLSFRKHLVIGQRLLLDFSKTSKTEFLQKREAYHKGLEDSFFAVKRIAGTRSYKIRRGDSLWVIANQPSAVPLWLIRQYNPDVNFSRLRPGDKITIPVTENKIGT